MQTLPDPGLELTPFRGIRYAPDRVSGIANVTSPPYDVIGTGNLDRLLSADPHNIVRLILPGRGREASERAAALLRAWLAEGVLARDEEPALYVYEQAADGWQQRGLIGLVRLGSASILPHENVMPGPVAGRRELMAATMANLEPIFLVHDGGTGELTGRAAAGEPLTEALTADGVRHRLWRVTDPAEHAAFRQALAGRQALIADGHHRYAAYLELRDRMQGAGLGRGPWDYGLAFLVDAVEYPPRLGPIHRVLPGLPPGRAAGLAAGAFLVKELPGDLDAALRRLSCEVPNGRAFLLAGEPGSFTLITDPDPVQLAASMPAGCSPAWRRLDAAVMQQLLMGALWGIEDNECDVLVNHDAANAVRAAEASGGTAVLCNPVPFSVVREIAEDGGRVPRKSTSFGPKPLSGLVIRTLGEPGE